MNMVDLSKANDNDGDGVVMISPTNQDGNNILATKNKKNYQRTNRIIG
ncbi:MAG: hypothetical protein ABI371_05925 [Gelidibacter sp.]